MALRFRVRTFKRCGTPATRGFHTQTLARRAVSAQAQSITAYGDVRPAGVRIPKKIILLNFLF